MFIAIKFSQTDFCGYTKINVLSNSNEICTIPVPTITFIAPDDSDDNDRFYFVVIVVIVSDQASIPKMPTTSLMLPYFF